MPDWLWRTIVGVVTAIAVLSIVQWANCAFVVAPRAWPLYEKLASTRPKDEELAPRPPACADSVTKAIAVLMALLTTLISLSRGLDHRKPPD